MRENILVIGSSGFLGRCITNQLASVKYDFFRDDITKIVDDTNISMVIFAAFVEGKAFDKVQSSMECFLRGCQACRIIYLSSDGIFDGEKGLYSEQDTPIPRTLYGQNLLLCETLIREKCSNYCIIRPNYIYGFSEGQLDKRLTRTRELLSRGDEVELFDDMYKSPLGVSQVAEAIIKLTVSGYNGIVHVAGNRLSVFEFHQQAMEVMGIDTRYLKSCSMPRAVEMLQDTSLDTLLWQRLTGMKAYTIEQTLSPWVTA
jgi:dTDP-4-dehydrorhamnose reductase